MAPAFVIALAGFGTAAYLLLLAGAAVPAWLLPAALAGAACTFRGRVRRPEPAEAAMLAILLAGLVVLGYGTLATQDREWDSAVSWTLRARVLLAEPTLAQPFFTADAVYAHSRDYPLLQPLALASAMHWLGIAGGRVLFLLLWLLLAALGWNLLHRLTLRGWRLVAATVGLALLPGLVSTGGGAVDSGYAELFLVVAMVAVAHAILLDTPVLLAASCLLLPILKPEGLVYGAAFVIALLLTGSRRQHGLAWLGFGGGAALQLPLQMQITMRESAPAGWWWPLGIGLAAAGTLCLKELLLRTQPRPRTLAIGLAAFALALVAALWSLRGQLAHASGTLFGSYLARLPVAAERLHHTPELLGAFAAHLVWLRRYGFAFVLLFGLLLLPRRHVGPVPSTSLLLWWGFGLLLVLLPFYVSPEQDLYHHLRSSMGRLLLHWAPLAWVLAVVWLWSPPREVAVAGHAGARR